MTVREETNEEADGIVGTRAFQEVCLMHPPHRELIARHLDPHAVDGIFGDNGEGRNDDPLFLSHPLTVATLGHALAPMHRAVLHQEEAVSVNEEVVTHPIRTAKLHRAAVSSRGLRILKDDVLRGIVAGRKEEEEEDEKERLSPRPPYKGGSGHL